MCRTSVSITARSRAIASPGLAESRSCLPYARTELSSFRSDGDSISTTSRTKASVPHDCSIRSKYSSYISLLQVAG
jgi:hypothetical protein